MLTERAHEFDDADLKNAGINLNYKSHFVPLIGIKQSVLLEVGFDTVAPNMPIDISSWAFDKAKDTNLNIIDNHAKGVKCYLPEYTFVEKLQTICTKVCQQEESGNFEKNFLRHFYDIHQLFQQTRVKQFIGTQDYNNHKKSRFKTKVSTKLSENLAFSFDTNPKLFDLYRKRFSQHSALYYKGSPSFEDIYKSLIEIRTIG